LQKVSGPPEKYEKSCVPMTEAELRTALSAPTDEALERMIAVRYLFDYGYGSKFAGYTKCTNSR
jgi:hypothetical protein